MAKKTTTKKIAKKPPSRRKPTTDGLKIIDQMFFDGKPERQAELEQAFADDIRQRAIDESQRR